MLSLHIEPTTRCTLKCPRCPRTQMIDTFGKKSLPIIDLNIDDFINFIDIPIDKIVMCGNYGDPIYHTDFIELVQRSKLLSKTINIITNGSYRSIEWWEELCDELTETDTITFSIDGTPSNFTEYRVNADWKSILDGINVCVKNTVRTKWKYIPFSFNENNISEANDISNNLGIDEFIVNLSDRWEKDDYLRPINDELIGSRDAVQQSYKTNSIRDFKIVPKCSSDTSHFISGSGYYAPCCYSMDNRFYYKNDWWKNKDIHAIKNSTLSEQYRLFNDFYATIQNTRPDYCVFNCGKNK